MKKNRKGERREEEDKPTEFFSPLCFVFFYIWGKKGGKAPKSRPNTRMEVKVKGVGYFSRWLNMSECLQHACTLF